jgi:release factor glutamine methyltransferase
VEAELLLRTVLATDRVGLYTQWEVDLPAAAWARYQELLAARAQGHPVHYLIGEREFMGLAFAVDSRVMIPRPETEGLVEYLLDHFREHPGPTMIDVGTGSGCIAISLAIGLPRARLLAIDISRVALEVARANAFRHRMADRITFIEGDLFTAAPLELNQRIDAIVSNPPYVPADQAATLPPEIRDHEPSVALFAPADGTAMHTQLIAESSRWLRPSGILVMEVGLGQAVAVAAAMRADGHYSSVEVRKDLAGIDRVVIGTAGAQRDAPR